MNQRTTRIAAAAAMALLLGACATAPETPKELMQARDAVRSAEQDPAVLAAAPLELKKATDSLSRANLLLAKGEPLAEISSAAYVAERQARTAMAIAQAKRNEDGIKAAEADRQRVRADANADAARRAQGQAQVAQGQANAAQAQANSATARADSADQRAATAQVQTMSAEAAAAEAQRRSAMLEAQMRELQAKPTDRGMLVTLGDVLFEFNRAEVKPGAQAQVAKLADFLKKNPERRVVIEGFTDNVGAAAYNQDLSRRRAESVAQALVAQGIAADRIGSAGFGMERPIASNTTDTNRALNRRVEVYISNGDQPVRSGG